MEPCATCGNVYDKSFQIVMGGETYTFDCFECAIQQLAPRCGHCDCQIIGHGVEVDDVMYCCAHCARRQATGAAVTRIVDRA